MKLSHALILACALATPALADSTAGKGDRKEQDGKYHMMKHDCDEMEDCLTEGLDLTEAQRQKIRDILQTARQKRDALRDQTHQQVREVLTPEQAKKLDAHRDEMMRYRAERMHDKADRMEERAKDMKKDSREDNRQKSRRQDSEPAR